MYSVSISSIYHPLPSLIYTQSPHTPGQSTDSIHIPNDQVSIDAAGADSAHITACTLVWPDTRDSVLMDRQQLGIGRGRRPSNRTLATTISIAERGERASLEAPQSCLRSPPARHHPTWLPWHRRECRCTASHLRRRRRRRVGSRDRPLRWFLRMSNSD